jgi:hypothetical protein
LILPPSVISAVSISVLTDGISPWESAAAVDANANAATSTVLAHGRARAREQ